MVKKIVQYCDVVMEVTWLLALVSIPLYFNIYTSRVFEPDKITLFRTLALIIGVAWLIKEVAIAFGKREVQSAKYKAQAALPKWRKANIGEIEPVFEPDGDTNPPDPRPFPRNFLLTPLIWPAMLLIFVYTIATILSVVPGASWWGGYQRMEGTYTLLSYIILFLALVYNLRERRQLERLISFVLLTNLPVALYGFLQHYQADPLPWQGDVFFRVTSTMGNAIFIAAYLIMVVPLILYRAIMTGSWLVTNRHLAKRNFRGKQRDNALSWVGLYGVFIIFEVGLFFAVLNFNANYHPNNSNLDVAQAAASNSPSLLDSGKRADEFNRFLGGDNGGPWWALPVGIILTFGLFFLFTVRRNNTDNNYLFRLFEFGGYLTLGVLTFMTLLFSQSRGPLLGLLVALFLFPPILLWRRKAWKWLMGWLAIGLVAGGILLMFNLPVNSTPLEPVFKIARQNPQIARLGQFLEANDGTGKVRQLIWKTDFEILGNALKNEPFRFFVGYGPESLYNISPPFYQPELARVEARNAIPDRSHNGYLDALVMTGLFGLLAYLVVAGTALYYAFKFLRRTKRLDYQVLLAALIAIIIAHQVEIQTGIQIAASWMMFWTTLALITVVGGFVMGGYGRAIVPAMAEAVAAPPPPLEEPEPVAVASNTAKNAKNGSKNKPRVIQPQQTVATMAQKPELAKVINPASTRQTKLANNRQSSTVNRQPEEGGAFGIGGSGAIYYNDYYSRPVQPLFWTIASIIGVIALAYAYFANYLPIAADAFFKQGNNLAGAQRWSLATPFFEEAVNSAPSEDYYYLFLGQAYMEQGRGLANDRTKFNQMTDTFKNGEASLLKAYDIAPLNPDHQANLARLYAVWAGADPQRNDEMLAKSVKWYEQVTNTRAPRNARLWSELGAAYLNQGLTKRTGPDQALLDKAIASAQKSVQIDDQFDFGRQVLGDIYYGAKQSDKAGEQYIKLAQLNPGQLASDSRYDERVRAIATSPLVKSEDLAKTFVSKDGKPNPLNEVTLAGITYYKGQVGDAETRLNGILARNPNYPLAMAYLTLVRMTQNRVPEAQKLAADTIEAARRVNDGGATTSIVQGMVGQILAQAQQAGPQPANPTTNPTTTQPGAGANPTVPPTRKP